MPPPRACPECHEEDSLVACGPGVERIADEVALLRRMLAGQYFSTAIRKMTDAFVKRAEVLYGDGVGRT